VTAVQRTLSLTVLVLCVAVGVLGGSYYRLHGTVGVLQSRVSQLQASGGSSARVGAITHCPVDVSPCVAWQDTSASRVVQDFELLDRNGAPVFWCNNTGGCWVGNDRLGVTGSSVFDEGAYLTVLPGGKGALVLGRQVLTGQDIARLHALEAASR
jgi:hypothetical protein